MSGVSATTIGIGEAVVAVIFGAGLLFWGTVYAKFRRTTMLLMGVGSLVVLAVDVVAINHLGRTSVPLLIGLGIVAVIGLFVMSGATPAALGLLADVSEGFEDDRSAIMGLYSVFLGLGQVIGAAVGAWAASWKGIDGLVVATAILLAIGMAALVNLRVHEADFVDGTASGSGGGSIRVAIRANMPPPGGVGTRPREAATKEDR